MPELQLRWYILQEEKDSLINWCGEYREKYLHIHEPVLQYSTDAGSTWKEVETFTEKR